MSEVSRAPWALLGESVIAVVSRRQASRRQAGRPLPEGIGRLPGPALVMANRFVASPVGEFCEVLVAEPARLGLRPAWCVTTSVVNTAEARIGGRLNWGLPRELGAIVWWDSADEVVVRWEERGVVLRVGTGALPMPFLVALRGVQRRPDGEAIIPLRLRGLATITRVTVDAPADDPLAALAGRHWGARIRGQRMRVAPARHPAGILATLVAPLRAPEPGAPEGVWIGR